MNNQKHTVSVTATMDNTTELVVKVNLSKKRLQEDVTEKSIVTGFESKQVEACLETGKLARDLEHLKFTDGKIKLVERWKSGVRYDMEEYDPGIRNRKRDLQDLKRIFKDFFTIAYKYGVEAIAGKGGEGMKHILRIQRNSIKIGKNKDLIIADKEIIYIDAESDNTMKIGIKDANKRQIHVRYNEYNQCSAYYEKEDGSRIVLLRAGELVDTKRLNLKWKEKEQHKDRGYKSMSLTIEGCRRSIKTHHLYMLLNTNALVMSLCMTADAPIVACDHVSGDKTDNRLENLQIITHSLNCKKRNLTTEEHLRFSRLYCYDYTSDLVMLSELIMKEIDEYKKTLN